MARGGGDSERVVEFVVGDQGVFCLGRKAAAAGRTEGVVVKGGAPIALGLAESTGLPVNGVAP